MRCLCMKRAGGKTTALVNTSAATNCPIITYSVAGKQHIKEIAAERGLAIPEPIAISENMRGKNFPNGILIDDAEMIIKAWAKENCGADVVACTMSIDDGMPQE